MDQVEREQFKRDAWRLYHDGNTVSERVRGLRMIIEAHHDRNPDAPSFDLYASHWLWAAQGQYDKEVLDVLIARFPLPARPRIQRGFSDWNSYGRHEYKAEVEAHLIVGSRPDSDFQHRRGSPNGP